MPRRLTLDLNHTYKTDLNFKGDPHQLCHWDNKWELQGICLRKKKMLRLCRSLMLDTHILGFREHVPLEKERQATPLKLLPSASLKLRGVCKTRGNHLQNLLSTTLQCLHMLSKLRSNMKLCIKIAAQKVYIKP